MDSDEYVVSRLRQILRRQHREGSSWVQLAKAIHRANDLNPDAKIDRRVLAELCGDDFLKVRLSVSQWIALDKYCVMMHEGPLFVRTQGLLDWIAESSEVAFYLAGRYHSELDTEAVSAFDLRALTQLVRSRLNRLSPRIFDTIDEADWRVAQEGYNVRANVAIGSPVASHATDRIMAKMLGFSVTTKTPAARLPFFIVRRDREGKYASGFLRKRVDAYARNAEVAATIAKDQRAIVFENNVFVGTESDDYSLLLAQRNPEGGQVGVVLAGLTGPSTRALASILQRGGPQADLPEWQEGERHPPILAVVYRHTLEPQPGAGARRARKAGRRKQPRQAVTGSMAVVGQVLLQHTDSGWRAAH